MIAVSSDHFGQGIQEITKIYGSEVTEAINLNEDLTTPSYTQKATSSTPEPRAVELKVVECPESMKQSIEIFL